MDAYMKLEVKRQLVHLILGMLTAFLVFFLDKVFVLGLIAVSVIATITVTVFSPENKFFRFLLNFLLKEFEREGKRFNGAIFFALGVMLPIILLDKITCAGIIAVFSFGDSASTIIGKFLGKHKFKVFYERSLEGSLAFVLFGFIGGMIFLDPVFSLELALLGAVIEILAFTDDNLLIPSALSLIVLLKYYNASLLASLLMLYYVCYYDVN